MDSSSNNKRNLLKFTVIGTVAIVCAFTASLYQTTPAADSVNFLAVSSSEERELESAFIGYIAKFGKSYASKTEYPQRFETFKRNYNMIQAHNQKEVTFQMELNQFSDMSAEEYMTGVNLPANIRDIGIKPDQLPIAKGLIQKVPTKMDWRDKNMTSEVMKQGKCKAGWAITAASTLESALALLENKTISQTKVSVQQLIDCDYTNLGCYGGYSHRAYDFIDKMGYALEKDYPYAYLGVRRSCEEAHNTKTLEYLDSKQYLGMKALNLKQLLNYQPIGVAINAPACVRSYKSGVLRPQDCDCTASSIEDAMVDHVLTLVGYSSDKKTKGCSGHWILKNSWGTEWGESGYLRLCISTDNDDIVGTCNLQAFPHLPDVGLLPEELPEEITEVDS